MEVKLRRDEHLGARLTFTRRKISAFHSRNVSLASNISTSGTFFPVCGFLVDGKELAFLSNRTVLYQRGSFGHEPVFFSTFLFSLSVVPENTSREQQLTTVCGNEESLK